KSSILFATYLHVVEFPVVLSAADVLRVDAEKLKRQFRTRAVIVGAGWHRDAYGQGPLVDLWLTPVNQIEGVFIHANWVEAILDSRVFGQSKTFAYGVELILSLAVAVVFSLRVGPGAKATCILLLCLGAMLVGYLMLENLGLFFDFYVPVLLIVAHAAVAKA